MPILPPPDQPYVLPDRLSSASLSATIVNASKPRQAIPTSRRLWALGDSVWDAGNTGASQGSGRIGFTVFADRSIVGAVLANLDGRVRYGGVCATSGYTSTQIRDTHLPTVLAQGAAGDVVLVGGPTNDANVGSVSATIAVLTDICEQLDAAGMIPLMTTVPPNKNPAQYVAWAQSVNAWMQVYANRHGYPFADVYAAVVNPATNTLQAAYDQGDTTHLNGTGAWAAGVTIAAAIKARIPAVPVSPLSVTNAYPSGLVAVNNVFLTDATSDGNPDGWTPLGTLGTSTRVLSTDAAVVGKALVETGNDNAVLVRSPSFTLTPGHRVLLGFKVKADTGGNWTVKLTNLGGAGTLCGYQNITLGNTDWATILFDFIVPTGWPSYSFALDLNNQATGGKVVRYAQPTMRSLTAEGIA